MRLLCRQGTRWLGGHVSLYPVRAVGLEAEGGASSYL